jgi:hypothetical protein
MILVPAEDRLLPLTEINFLDLTVDDLFEHMLRIKRANCPSWTNESRSDFGVHLMWMFAVLCKWMVANMERVVDNCYVGTVIDREHMRRIGELFRYELAEATAATVTVTFTTTSGHPEFTIPAKTKVGTEETADQGIVIFETDADTLVTVGTANVDIACTQGETVTEEVIGSSEGTASQFFPLTRQGVIWQSETIEVYDGASWVTWTRVDEFINSDGDDNHYRVTSDEDGFYYVIFGDGTFGAIPVRGTNNVRGSYRVGGGTAGNVAAASINRLVSAVDYVTTVTNAAAAAGGTDRETLAHAKVAYRASASALQRAISPADWEYLTENYASSTYGRIAVSKTTHPGASVIKVIIVPEGGGTSTTAFKEEIKTYLEGKRTVCTAIQVVDATYVDIDVTVEVQALLGYGATTIETNVRARLMRVLSPTYQDPDTGLYTGEIGRDVTLALLYREIMAAEGVAHCTITTPTTDTLITQQEIANPGTITITVVSA